MKKKRANQSIETQLSSLSSFSCACYSRFPPRDAAPAAASRGASLCLPAAATAAPGSRSGSTGASAASATAARSAPSPASGAAADADASASCCSLPLRAAWLLRAAAAASGAFSGYVSSLPRERARERTWERDETALFFFRRRAMEKTATSTSLFVLRSLSHPLPSSPPRPKTKQAPTVVLQQPLRRSSSRSSSSSPR